MKLLKKITLFLFGFIICAIVMKYLSPEQPDRFFVRLVKSFGILTIGFYLGGGLMACLSAAKYDDIQSGRSFDLRTPEKIE